MVVATTAMDEAIRAAILLTAMDTTTTRGDTGLITAFPSASVIRRANPRFGIGGISNDSRLSDGP